MNSLEQNINPTLNINCCYKKKLIFKFLKKPEKEVDFGISKKNYKRFFFKCEKCNHYYAKHKKNLIKNLYKENYFVSTYKNYKKLKETVEKILNLPIKKSDNKQRILRVQNFFKKKKIKKITLLDVGAGTGVFPISIMSRDIRVFANETNKTQCTFIKKYSKGKIKVINSSFLKKNFNKQTFDFITFNKVLEHIERPSKFLIKAKKILKKNGYIYLEVPDIIAKKKLSQFPWEEFSIGHFHVFSPKSLKLFVENLNFKIVKLKRIVEPSGKHTIFSIIKKND